jgi:hypothetical protein
MGVLDAVAALILVRCSYALDKTADNAELVVRVLRIQALAPGAGLLPSSALLHALYRPPIPAIFVYLLLPLTCWRRLALPFRDP